MIRCIAIDDEPLALKQMESYISKTPALEAVGFFDNAIDAMPFVQQNHVDLMFVDINMPDLSGMEFVRSLKNPPGIIFTTAYSEYAMEGFKVDAIDYLLKPIAYSDFLKAVNKAVIMIAPEKPDEIQIKTDSDFLLIKSENRIVKINFDEIEYIEGMREYVRFHLKERKAVMTLMSMKKLEAQLPSDQFMRIHRSWIVNLKKITTIERNRIVFGEDVYIPISEQYQKVFREWMEQHFL